MARIGHRRRAFLSRVLTNDQKVRLIDRARRDHAAQNRFRQEVDSD